MFTTSNPSAKLLAVFAAILTTGSCLAQDSTAAPAQTPSTVQANPQNEQQLPASAPKTITVPAGILVHRRMSLSANPCPRIKSEGAPRRKMRYLSSSTVRAIEASSDS